MCILCTSTSLYTLEVFAPYVMQTENKKNTWFNKNLVHHLLSLMILNLQTTGCVPAMHYKMYLIGLVANIRKRFISISVLHFVAFNRCYNKTCKSQYQKKTQINYIWYEHSFPLKCHFKHWHSHIYFTRNRICFVPFP